MVVKNAKGLKLTGKKMEEKGWVRHTGFPGGIRVDTIGKLMATNPADVQACDNENSIYLMCIQFVSVGHCEGC